MEGEHRKRWWHVTLPEVVALLFIVGLFAYLLMPAAGKVREDAKRAACKNNLRQIGIALHLYADDCGEAFPSAETVPSVFNVAPGHTVQALHLLYKLNYTDNPMIFSCPASRSDYNDFRKPGSELKPASTSYAYDSRHTRKHVGPVIIAGDCQDDLKPISANHGYLGGVYLAIDGSVQWIKRPPDPNATKLCVDPSIDDDIWSPGPAGYVHDSCLTRAVK